MAAILVIETSTEVCSVALTIDGTQVDLIESKEGQNHARLVTVYADRLLIRNKINAQDLVAVAVSKGPGSYTGLRIGVSTAKGICFARHIPLIAIGTLEAMTGHIIENRTFFAISQDKPTLFCPMIDARRMEVFSMLYKEDGSVMRPISALIIDETFLSEELGENQVVFFGNGSEKCSQVIQSPNALFIPHVEASAKYMCNLAWQLYNKNQFEDVAYFEPFYLKDFVATVSKKNIPG
ncbi:MAG TPA: tRNA (adenosine(37)-N6)-threonylcarbamoyltransferase complex dimerization subunit type 1 TsaB [Prolixibacteraceae bacterium]|jgi:tRNA threonylcarbamoyladenosine biosynthesis protein TsaB|nr:tRNA (adenosine(37)-N6)-threonylcarbamoyltransferase complex dimerization subunit type 1 TsaB [Prolixibacteraceae bacterium]